MLYDAFELQKMEAYPDNHGGTIRKPIEDCKHDEGCLQVFWVIQGHLPGGGVETLAERDTLEKAEQVYNYLCGMLACCKKYDVIVSIIIGG